MGPLTATRDHIVPRHSLGSDRGRWVICCVQCNGLKGALTPTAWFAFIDANPGYWRDFATNKDVIRWLLDLNRYRRANGQRGIVLFSTLPDNFMALVNRA